MDLISSIDDGPHTKKCDGASDCCGECWDSEEWPTPEDLQSQD